MRFVDRQRELQALDAFLAARQAGLMILYGRRRVGKTMLLSHWLNQRAIAPALFWTATTRSAPYQLRDFSQALMRFDPAFKSLPSDDFTFRDWETALERLGKIAAALSSPVVVIIDEFTHLIQSDPPVVSVFQKLWDHQLSQVANLRLILTGSMMGLIERDVLSSRAPLYGRATTLIRLRQLPFGTLREILPHWSPAERVAVYAICGGIPAYLNVFVEADSFTDGLGKGLSAGSLMLSDPVVLLHDQLRDPQVYESVLSSIASGFHTWNEIAQMAGIAESNLGFYIKNLQALELVERRDPVLSSPAGWKGRYHVRDPFLRFYYRFIAPHITAIERGDLRKTLKIIQEDLRAFIGTYVFEELCREWVYAEGAYGGLDFAPEVVGSFWTQHRGAAVQLDVVAASRREKRLLIGEAKWGTGSVARTVLTDLVARGQRMPQVIDPDWKTHYMLFAREGFTEAVTQTAQSMGARLVTLPEIENRLVEMAFHAPLPKLDEIEF